MADTSGIPYETSYEPPSSIQNFHDYMSLRFGHTDNITVLFEDGSLGDGTTTEYVTGLIFAGCIIIGFFLLWCILLMIFMCVGHNVGFLSGSAFLRKPEPATEDSVHGDDDDDADIGEGGDEMVNDENMMAHQSSTERYNDRFDLNSPIVKKTSTDVSHGDNWKSRPSICRIIFIVSGMICITFGLLMVTQGITNLQTTINTVDQRANYLNQLAGSAQTLVKRGMRDAKTQAEIVRNILLDDLRSDAFCPNDPDLIGNEVGQQLKTDRDNVESLLSDLTDFKDEELADFEDAMEVLFDGTSEIIQESDSFKVNDWQSLIVIIPYTVFPSLLIVAALMAFRDVSLHRYNCVINWFVLPIFILMTIVAFTFAGAMTIAAGVNSDFCLPGGRSDGSPDNTLLDIMKVRGYDESSYPYRVTEFYISQCSGDSDPLTEIRDYRPELEENLQKIQDMLAEVRDGTQIDELALYCNRNFDVLDPLLVNMIAIIESLKQSLDQVLDLAKCGRIIPLYTDTVYKATCQYSPKAISWIFSCCLILGFFGMVMITLRSSMKLSVADPSYVGHFPQNEQDGPYFQDENQGHDETMSGGDEVEEVEPNPQNLEDHGNEEVDYKEYGENDEN